MTHFSCLDSDTFEFLVTLKANNDLWYRGLIGCAKRSPMTAKACLKDIRTNLAYLRLNVDAVNVFQLCKAVNAGIATSEAFQGCISNSAWHVYRALMLQKKLDEFNRNAKRQ